MKELSIDWLFSGEYPDLAAFVSLFLRNNKEKRYTIFENQSSAIQVVYKQFM